MLQLLASLRTTSAPPCRIHPEPVTSLDSRGAVVDGVARLGVDQGRAPAWHARPGEKARARPPTRPPVAREGRKDRCEVGRHVTTGETSAADKTASSRQSMGNLRTRSERTSLKSRVFVDGNNVMGSRPDGWWRDRAGAARRIVAEIIPLALGHGGVWTIVFDGKEPPRMPPSPECLIVVHTGHGRRDGADDRIVELVHERSDRAASLVYTSDAKLRTRVKSLGTQVMGSGVLLSQIATLRATMEPTDNGHTPNSADGSESDNHVNEELPTICTAEATNRENSR